jgi:hypothetical protein
MCNLCERLGSSGFIHLGYSPLTPITALANKLDPADKELNTLIENNQSWAEAVTREKPNYFKEMALKQEPKVLWIGEDSY